MNFSSEHFLKWFSIENSSSIGEVNWTLLGKAIVVARDSQQKCVGFSVLEPRDLNEAFFKRLTVRIEQVENRKHDFILYAPPLFRERVQMLLKSNGQAQIKIHYTDFLNIKKHTDRFFIRDQARVVNVDDSPVLLKFLKHSIEQQPSFKVVAQFSDSDKAAEEILKLQPDLVTMDIQMPRKNGVEVVREILSRQYVPIIMISSLTPEEGPEVFQALNLGAFDYLQKPRLEEKDQFSGDIRERFVAAIASVGRSSVLQRKVKYRSESKNAKMNLTDKHLWCLGASTGGTQALTEVMTSLPTEIPPILIVQHIPPVFSKSFADSLNSLCPFEVKEAVHGEEIRNNHVYVAPGGQQMGVTNEGGKLRIVISDDAPVNRFKPSVDYLFNEVCKISDRKIVAGILTGMGKDGAAGLLALKSKGVFTFAQDEATSAVYGMPRAAIENGAAQKIVALDKIAQTLIELTTPLKKAG